MKIWDHIKSVFSGAPPSGPPPEPAAEPAAAAPGTGKHTRTDSEKALIAAFKADHRTLLEKLEDGIYDANSRMKKAEDPVIKAELCRKTISAYQKLQTVCSNTGPGGSLYFEDMWEHCSNTGNPDFRFIDPVEAILRELPTE